MPTDRALPDILMPGNAGSGSPGTWQNPNPGSSSQSPISPIEGIGSFDPTAIPGSPPANASYTSRDVPPPDGRPIGSREFREPEPFDPQEPPRDRSRPHPRTSTKSPGNATRLCKECGEQLTGQFVRALAGTYHLECFKCRVCNVVYGSAA